MSNIPAQDKNPLKITQAARILGISVSTLRQLENEGKIIASRDEKGHRVFSRREISKLKVVLDRKKKERIQVRIARLKKKREASLTLPVADVDLVEEVSTATLKKNANILHKVAYSLLGAYVFCFSLVVVFWQSPKVSNRILNLPLISKLAPKDDGYGHILSQVLGVRDANTAFELRVSVPTNFDATVTIGEELTVTGLSSGGITTDTITTGVANVSTLNMTGTATINNLQAIDDTSEITLEDTLDLSGDVSGPLNDVTVDSIGGADVGDIEDSDGNVVYIDGGEIVSGDITDLDTESITKIGTIDTGVWNGTVIGPTYGGTGLSSYTTGDIIYASAANTLANESPRTKVRGLCFTVCFAGICIF